MYRLLLRSVRGGQIGRVLWQRPTSLWMGLLLVLVAWCPPAAAAYVQVNVTATDNCTGDADPHVGFEIEIDGVTAPWVAASYCEGIPFTCAWSGIQKPITNQIDFLRYVDTCKESVEVKIRKIDKGGNLFNLSDDFCGEQVVSVDTRDPSPTDGISTCIGVISSSPIQVAPEYQCSSISLIPDVDDDKDGLADFYEDAGELDLDCDGAGDFPLPPGVDSDHKDLLVEMDVMAGTGLTLAQISHVIDTVVESFELAPVDAGGTPNPDGQPGIRVWVDKPGTDDFPAGDGTTILPIDLSRPDGRIAAMGTFDPAKEPYFRYIVVGLEGWEAPGARESATSPVGSCVDGIDNDGDGRVDRSDRTCHVDPENSEDGVTTPGSCLDGIDNGATPDGADGLDADECQGIPREGNPGAAVDSCFNGVDDGADGADAADSDCLAGGTYNPTLAEDGVLNACGDGLDNGANGADAADPACAAVPRETGSTLQSSCWNQRDDDGDGLFDLQDPDCAAGVTWTEDGKKYGSCWDGVDNQGDGADDQDLGDCIYRSGAASPADGTIVLNTYDAGTFMHELGHTLALGHGGPYFLNGALRADVVQAQTNSKPNYSSVMSYSFQRGIPRAYDESALEGPGAPPNSCWDRVDNDGDGASDYRDDDCLHPGQDIDGDGLDDHAFLDYSPPRDPFGFRELEPITNDYELPELIDENAVVESQRYFYSPMATHDVTYVDLLGKLQQIRSDGFAPNLHEGGLTGGSCSDGLDNDGNSLIDWQDLSCYGFDVDGNGIIFGGPRVVVLRTDDVTPPMVLEAGDDWSNVRLPTVGPLAPGDLPEAVEPPQFEETVTNVNADLVLTASPAAVHGNVGGSASVIWLAQNLSGVPAPATTLSVQLPAGVATAPLPTGCVATGAMVVCSLGDLGPLASASVNLPVVLGSNPGASVRQLVGTVAAAQTPDPNLANNTARTVVTSNPVIASFDDPASWNVQGATLVPVTGGTEGNGALRVSQCGYVTLTSDTFNTAEWEKLGDRFAIDVFVPAVVPNIYWVGDIQFSLRSINNQVHGEYLGLNSLTTLPRGQWSTMTFTLTPTARALLAGDYSAAELQIFVNTNLCSNGVRLDNLRLVNNVSTRTVFHGSQASPQQSTGGIGTLESLADWSSPGGLSVVATPRTQGTGALRVSGPGWAQVTSRKFSTVELGGSGSELVIDVLVQDPPDNPYWVGDLQVHLTCPSAGVHGAYLGRASLGGAFFDEYNAVRLPLPASMAAVLQGNYADCRLEIGVGGMPMPEGFLLDNLTLQ